MKGTLSHVFFEGNIVPADQAKISIASHSLQYGITALVEFAGSFGMESPMSFV